jgi:glycerol-3-phosphate acyltransferase PlsX
MKKKVVLDCLGGDNGIIAMVDGAVAALQNNPELSLILVGDESIIKPKIIVAGLTNRVEIIHTTENIPMDMHPTDAVRKHPNGSIILCLGQLKTRDDCGAFVSAGSTGAVLTGGFLKIGRIEGVSRPALCPNLPTKTGTFTMLIDCGANADCKVENLVHFAIMANEYKKASGIATPKIALLNVGVENTKGSELARATFNELTKLHAAGQINFIGNIEGNAVLDGECDIIVADGFTGNILLKSLEGISKFIFSKIKHILSKGLRAKIAGLLVGGKIKKVRADYVDNVQAGSMFIGLKKPVIKCHGHADARTVSLALEYANSIMDLDLEEKIKTAVALAEHELYVKAASL